MDLLRLRSALSAPSDAFVAEVAAEFARFARSRPALWSSGGGVPQAKSLEMAYNLEYRTGRKDAPDFMYVRAEVLKVLRGSAAEVKPATANGGANGGLLERVSDDVTPPAFLGAANGSNPAAVAADDAIAWQQGYNNYYHGGDVGGSRPRGGPNRISVDQRKGLFQNPVVMKPQQQRNKDGKLPAWTGYDVLVLRFLDGFHLQSVVDLANRTWPDVLLATNTRLTKSDGGDTVQIKGYDVFKQDFKKASDNGIVVYTNNRLEYTVLYEMESSHFQAIWIKLTHPDSEVTREGDRRKIVTIVGNVCNVSKEQYSNSEGLSFMDYLNQSINKVQSLEPGCSILIQGDFAFEDYAQLLEMRDFFARVHKMALKAVKPDDSERVTAYLMSDELRDLEVIGDQEEKRALATRVRRLRCHVCRLGFRSPAQMSQHRSSAAHKKNFCYLMWKEKRAELTRPKFGMTITCSNKNPDVDSKTTVKQPEPGLAEVTTEPSSDKTVELKLVIKNESKGAAVPREDGDAGGGEAEVGDPAKGVVLKAVQVLTDMDGFKLKDGFGVTKCESEREEKLRPGVRVLPERKLVVTLSFQKDTVGQHRVPIIVQLRPYGAKMLYYMALEVVVRVVSPDQQDLEPVEPFAPQRLVNRTWECVKPVAEPGWKPEFFKAQRAAEAKGETAQDIQTKKKLKLHAIKLWHYEMEPDTKRLLMNGLRVTSKTDSADMLRLKAVNTAFELGRAELKYYAERFRNLLYAEEHQSEVDIRHYDMSNVTMTKQGMHLSLEVPGLAENRPSVLKGDKLYVHRVDQPHLAHEGYVHMVHDTKVMLGFGQKLRSSFVPGMRFNVQFTFCRYPQRLSHRALETAEKNDNIVKMLIPNFIPPKCDPVSPASFEIREEGQLFNRDIAKNAEQLTVVNQVVNPSDATLAAAAPYLIFGPPGTGKTVTVVECMKQIYKLKPGSRVLACAPSNSAADLLAKRLLNSVPKSELVRLYAMSRDEKTVPAELLEVSNFKRGEQTPVQIMKYRFVITTIVHSGRLVTCGVPRGHFSHIFLDEAGHAPEPEALIPIAGFVSPSATRVILAGDPKQLGPIIRSPIALRQGLDISLLERLMTDKKNIKIYQKDPTSGLYDSRFIVKLLDNFRSHRSLLQLPSSLFYDGELRARASPVVTDSMLQWEQLPKKGFPIVFHGVVGVDKREGRSPSFFNTEEVVVVGKYLEALLKGVGRHKVAAKDIGVIAPYRRQVQKIREHMNKKFQRSNVPFTEVTVGSTEELQGQERRAVLISTVRSQEEFIQSDIQHKLGFLKNPKRFNVALTRAMCVMVVVGNPILLRQDPKWRAFIDYVYDNGGYKGVKYDREDSAPALDDADVRLRLEQMGLAEAEDEDEFVHISQRELQEVPEWRADF